MDLNALETFIDVVRAGSFSAAARRASLPRSSVSLPFGLCRNVDTTRSAQTHDKRVAVEPH
jgi:hypothetical protein